MKTFPRGWTRTSSTSATLKLGVDDLMTVIVYHDDFRNSPYTMYWKSLKIDLTSRKLVNACKEAEQIALAKARECVELLEANL